MSSQPFLIETIRIQNGRVKHIPYHNARCNAARRKKFGCKDEIDLRRYIDTNEAPSSLTKCRITFTDAIQSVEYEPYQIKPIQFLQLIEGKDIDYAMKYKDRTALSQLFQQKKSADDILITRNGFVTDTYYANVAFLKDDQWYTPKKPLLEGTMRSYLLQKGRIELADIHKNDILDYAKVAVLNAMIPFGKIVIDTNKIYT